MTDNQFKQLFNITTKSAEGVQRLERDVSELKKGQAKLEAGQAEMRQDIVEMKQDISDLKIGQARLEERQTKLEEGQAKLVEGQVRIEKEIKIMSRAMGNLAKDSIETRARVDVLEDEMALSN